MRFDIAITFLLALIVSSTVAADVITRKQLSTPFFSTPNFELTEFDLYMYLSPPKLSDGQGYDWGTPPAVKEGVEQLYALSTLRHEANASGVELLSEDQQNWIAQHAVSMALVRQYLALRLEQELAKVDWEAMAYERFLANPTEFAAAEQITLRTLLLRTECRSESAAMALAAELLAEAQREGNFEALVIQHTEDKVAAEKGGLMESVQIGQTVPEFEEAAFGLESAGDFAPPTLTQYGVHLIQLLDKQPASVPAYEEVKPQIMAEVRRDVSASTVASLRRDARAKRPDGLVVHQAEIDAFMESLSED